MSLSAEPPAAGPGELVVVVDDEPDVVETTAVMLEEHGLATITETDPEDALGAVDDDAACVVSDYQMPGMDGLELLEAIRAEHPDLPFVLFTGKGSEAIASDAIEAGVTAYLQKGKHEQYDRLANCVATAIERYHTTRELEKRRQQVEAVFENAFDGIFILDMDDAVIVEANERACELLAYPYEELVGTDIATIHPEDYEEYVEIGRGLIRNDERRRVESVCYTSDGEVIPSDITAAPMQYEDRDFLLTIMRPQRRENE